MGYRAIINDGRIPPRPHAEAEVFLAHQHPHLTGELAVAIGYQPNVLHVLTFAPLVHDKGVIDRDTINRINTRGLEFWKQPLKVRQLKRGTCGCECTW